MIDVLRRDGSPAGVQKTKSDVHRDGDWHRAAHVWIVADARVLLQRRSVRKENYPGLWDVSAAGHLSAGETAVEAAVRETFEEIGLHIDAEDLEYVTTNPEQCVLNGGAYIDNEIHEVFVVRRDVDVRSLRLDPAEVDEVSWFAIEDVLSRAAAGDPALVPHRDAYRVLRGVV